MRVGCGGGGPVVHVYSEEELSRLGGLSSRMQPLAEDAARRIQLGCSGLGCYPKIVFGTRTLAEQLAIWAKGRRRVGPDAMSARSWVVTDPGLLATDAFPGLSAHQAPDGGPTGGDAVDIALLDERTGLWLRGGRDPDPRWEAIVGAAADAVGLTWGGRFVRPDGSRFFDGAHLQHPHWRRPGRSR